MGDTSFAGGGGPGYIRCPPTCYVNQDDLELLILLSPSPTVGNKSRSHQVPSKKRIFSGVCPILLVLNETSSSSGTYRSVSSRIWSMFDAQFCVQHQRHGWVE